MALRHILVFPDGNRRWARDRGLSPSAGHVRGAWKIDDLITWCNARQIGHLSLYLVSAANLRRDPDVLNPMIKILNDVVRYLARTKAAKIVPVGDLSILPRMLASSLIDASNSTGRLPGMTINLIAGYSPHWELLQALETFSNRRNHSKTNTTVNEHELSSLLFPYGDQPDVELIIRTSGEYRLSGLLPWQSAHAELYFTDVLWPDFQESHFQEAIDDFTERDLRFGL